MKTKRYRRAALFGDVTTFKARGGSRTCPISLTGKAHVFCTDGFHGWWQEPHTKTRSATEDNHYADPRTKTREKSQRTKTREKSRCVRR